MVGDFPNGGLDLYRYLDRFKREGLRTSLRLARREMLTARMSFREPLRWSEARGAANEPQRLKGLVEWEIVLEGLDWCREHEPCRTLVPTSPS